MVKATARSLQHYVVVLLVLLASLGADVFAINTKNPEVAATSRAYQLKESIQRTSNDERQAAFCAFVPMNKRQRTLRAAVVGS